MELKSILVAVDPSPASHRAARLAARLADATHASLHLVAPGYDPLAHVVASRAHLDVDRVHGLLVEQTRAGVEAALEDALPGREMARILTVRLGRPRHVLAHQASRLEPDIIVVGTPQPGDPDGGGLKSEAVAHLLRTARRPLLVAGPSDAPPRRIVAALDVSVAAGPTLRFAAAMADIFGAGLEALHVLTLPDLPVEWLGSPDAMASLERAEEQATRDEWTRLLPEGCPGRIVRGHPVHTLREEMGRDPSSLLVMGAQGRGWVHRLVIGSTTEAMIAEPPCTLAIVPVNPESP